MWYPRFFLFMLYKGVLNRRDFLYLVFNVQVVFLHLLFLSLQKTLAIFSLVIRLREITDL